MPDKMSEKIENKIMPWKNAERYITSKSKIVVRRWIYARENHIQIESQKGCLIECQTDRLPVGGDHSKKVFLGFVGNIVAIYIYIYVYKYVLFIYI